MRSTTRAAAIAAAAVALLIGSASAALAASATIDDKRYDVLLENNTLASKGTYAQRVAASNVDVDKLTVNHGKNFVSIRVNLHKFGTANSVGNIGVFGAVKVNGGAADDFYFDVFPDGEGGIWAETYVPDEEGTECYADSDTNPITGSSKMGTNGFVQVYIPRACFNNPKHLAAGGFSAFNDGLASAKTNADEALGEVREMRVAKAETNQEYFDPINSVYFGASAYTKWLARG